MLVNVADRVPDTEAEGPGRRYALWVQGCPLRCPGCCNPHMLEFKVANRISVETLLDEIATTPGIEGVTFLGGEPFSQAEGLGELALRLQHLGLTVMVFSGFTLEQLRAREDAALLLEHTDLLVDGPYLRQYAVYGRRWIGSANQRVHFLSNAYTHLQEEWDTGPNTVEIRVVDGEIQINGFPTKSLQDLLKDMPR